MKIKTTTSAIRARRGESGQAMTEAAIGMSLMAFVWVLAYFASYMVNHSGRCAVAARHAAWSKGNGVEVSADSLRGDVFFDNLPMVRLTTATEQTSDATGDLSGNIIVEAILGLFPDIQKADVAFGVEEGGAVNTWPFMLTKTQFPFMPDSTVPTLMNVSVHCEWDSVNETWDSIGGMLESIVEGIFR